MAFNITLAEVHSNTDAYLFMTDPGVYRLTSGRLLAGLVTGVAGTNTEWWKSDDDGATWSHLSDTGANPERQAQRLVHFKQNAAAFAYGNSQTTDAYVVRTADGGATWNEVAHYSQSRPPSIALWTGAALSYDAGKALLGGRFSSPTMPDGRHDTLRSLDEGLTWELAPNPNTSTANTIPYCLAARPGGVWLAGMDGDTLFRTTDYGAHWTTTGALPNPSGLLARRINDITWITNDIVIAVGQHSATVDQLWADIYRSTDAGQTWTNIPRTDIAGWPTAGTGYQCHMVKRLTRDLVALGLMRATNINIEPWRFSLDGGLTWPLIPTAPAINPAENNGAPGACCTSNDGHIILSCITRGAGPDRNRIFRGTVTC